MGRLSGYYRDNIQEGMISLFMLQGKYKHFTLKEDAYHFNNGVAVAMRI